MKFLNLVYEGILEKKGTIDFGNKIQGCTVLSDTDPDFYMQIAGIALYGAQGDYGRFTLPSRLEFRFSYEDAEYAIMRIFDNFDGKPGEMAVITDGENKTVFAEGCEAVQRFIEEKTALSKTAFEKLLIINKEEITRAFASDAAAREAYIAQAAQNIASAGETQAKLAVYKDKEKELLDYIESIPAVTKKEIKDCQQLEDARRVEAESLSKDVESIFSDITKAKDYETASKEYAEAAAYQEKLKSQKAEVDALAARIAKSRAASEIGSIYTEYKRVESAVAEDKTALAKKEKELEDINKKYQDGQASAQKYEKNFIYCSEKKELLEKNLRELISSTSVSPQGYKIGAIIDSYYADTENRKAELLTKLAAAENEFRALSDAVAELKAKKAELKNPSSYKKGVSDAALIEENLKRVDAETKQSDERLQNLQKERADLSARHTELTGTINSLTARLEGLKNSILRDYPSFQEAVNADVLYKQTIYGKHLIVSANEVEMDAVEKKIESVKKASEIYATKLSESLERRKEVEAHLEKLNAKLNLLTEKRNDYLSFNKMRAISDDLVYGSRCPVCDGFITVKKELPQKDTKAIDTQIDALNAEIQKSEAALIEVVNSIGQYNSAARVSQQYLDALNKTRDAKLSIIKEILDEYNCMSIAEMFAKVKEAADNSNMLTLAIDDYHETDAKLRAAKEADAVISEALNKLVATSIPAETERLNSLLDEFKRLTAEYEKLQSFLNGENADQLLMKLQVVDKEYETLEQELDAKEEKLSEVTLERDELKKAVTMLETRAVPVEVAGQPLDYSRIVVKAVMDDLGVIIKEIDKVEEEREIAKTRLVGVRRVIARAGEQKAALENEIAALKAKIESATAVSKEMFSKYETRFMLMGVDSQSSLDALILEEDVLKELVARVDGYKEEVIKLEANMDRLNNIINESRPYYEALDGLKARLEEFKTKEQQAIILLNDAVNDKNLKTKYYKEHIDKNLSLSYLQSRIKGIEDILPALDESGADAKKLADIIAGRASSKIKKWSNDKYRLTLGDAGAVLINEKKGKEVKADKYTREERQLYNLGLSLAFSETLINLSGGDIAPAVALSTEDCDKPGLTVFMEAAKEREITALLQDEAAFYKTVSKLV